jgi:hypothetical protein
VNIDGGVELSARREHGLQQVAEREPERRELKCGWSTATTSRSARPFNEQLDP